jgi:hypothetical protein
MRAQRQAQRRLLSAEAMSDEMADEMAGVEVEEAAEGASGQIWSATDQIRKELERAQSRFDAATELAVNAKRALAKCEHANRERAAAAAAAEAARAGSAAAHDGAHPGAHHGAPPPSFSKIPDLAREIAAREGEKRFPLLAQSRMLELELHAGQMLYLPAGWFHEVSSDGGGAGDGLHCALNYWYHPPKLGTPFERPHGRDGQPFWESRMPRPPPQS